MSIFHLPDLGEGLAEATVVRWHVAAGDDVQAEQLLVSVETAKAIVDVPSPQSGHIVALLAAAGATVPTHAPLVEFTDVEAAAAGTVPAGDAGSVVGNLSATASRVSRTGFLIGRHRHTEARLQQSQHRRATRPTSTALSASTTPALFEGGEALEPMRRAMAENLAKAQRDVVPVTLFGEAEIRFEDRHELTARLILALVAAAHAEPALNTWYDGQRQVRRLHEAVHVGIAVDSTHGLYVPVLRHAEQLSLDAITRQVSELRQAAEAHRLTAAMQSGATLTLSNFGSLAGRFATPLVMPPQVAILGSGQVHDEFRLGSSGQPERLRLLPLSLTVDHRAVTGGEAARFLAAVTAALEDVPA